jgi:hypothetical protein
MASKIGAKPPQSFSYIGQASVMAMREARASAIARGIAIPSIRSR